MYVLRVLAATTALLLIAVGSCLAVGSIAGYITDPLNDGMYETEIFACKSGASSTSAYYRCQTSGYYSLSDLSAGTYSLGVNDPFHIRPRLRSFVPVQDNKTTPGDIKIRSTYYVRGSYLNAGTAVCSEIRQTFVATGDVVKITFWMPTSIDLNVSIHNAQTGVQIGPTKVTNQMDRDTVKWLNGEVPLTPGSNYYVRVTRTGGGTFQLYCNTNQNGNLYPYGQAYYDGVAQPTVDIGMVIESDDDGLATMYQRPVLNTGFDGTEIGQTFKARGTCINLVTVQGTSWQGSSGTPVTFSIHEGGPGGAQIGISKTQYIRDYRPMCQYMVVTWQPGEVTGLIPGQTYYLRMLSTGFYVTTNTNNPYPDGMAYQNGVARPNDDLCITIAGEKTLNSSVCTIWGKVRDGNGNPVSGATISTTNFGYTATSDSNGNYTLKVTGDIYTLKCEKSGYISQTVSNFDATCGTSKELNFTISIPGSISGYVRDTYGNPISGASVTTNPGSYSATSQSNGYYSITGVTPATYTVSASKAGYQAQSKSGIVVYQASNTTCDFNLTPNTALQNPSFEITDASNNPTYWTKYGDGLYVRTGVGYASISAYDGQRYATNEASWAYPKSGGVYQSFWVPSGLPLTVSAWTVCYGLGGGAAHTFSRVGIDPSGGTNPSSGSVQWSSWYNAPADGVAQWVQISKTAIPTVNMITLFLDYLQEPRGSYPNAYEWQINGFDLVSAVSPQLVTIAEARQLPDNSFVYLGPGVITAKFVGSPNYFYIEAADRACALKVNGDTTYSIGDLVKVVGTIKTSGSERYVDPSVIQLVQAGYGALEPIGMKGLSIGGSSNGVVPGVTDGVGTNTIGLLVNAWGRVSTIDSTSFYLNDGSGVQVKVQAYSSSEMPANGSFAVVTGISSTYDAGSGKVGRLIRATSGGIRSY